jgi:hypothetical protein
VTDVADTQIGAIEQQTSEAVGENRRKLEAKLAQIRTDADLSESAKERLATEASRQAAERHGEIVGEFERETAEVLEANEKRLFRLSYPEGVVTDSEREIFLAGYRQVALSLLDASEETISRAMSRAFRTGDTVLAQACYHESVERGLGEIGNEYRERHPDAARIWQTYVQSRMRAQSNEALLGRALLRSASPVS